MPEYDLLLRGGIVIAPASGFHAAKDVGVSNVTVAAICDPGSESRAREFVDADGLIVVPGMIDMHVYVFPRLSLSVWIRMRRVLLAV